MRFKSVAKTMKTTLFVHEKMEIYNSFVLPVLTYNLHASPIIQKDQDKLNSFHRRQLRRILNRRTNQQEVSCLDIYRRTAQRPIMVDITKARWKMLGHICGQPMDNLANAMTALSKQVSFNRPQTKIRIKRKRLGQKTLSMDNMLTADLKLMTSTFPEIYDSINIPDDIKVRMRGEVKKIISEEKLATLRTIAANRTVWHGLTRAVTTAKNIQWYDAYCQEKNWEQPLRFDKRRTKIPKGFELQHRERQPVTRPTENERPNKSQESINPGAPNTRQRAYIATDIKRITRDTVP